MPSWPNQYHHVTGSGILAKVNWFEDTESHWECLILKPESMWYLSMSLFVAFPLNGCSVKLSCFAPHLVWTAGHTPHYFVLTTFARASKTTLLQLVLRYLLNFLNDICNNLHFDEAGCCSGGDGGGCLQGCDATGEHFVNCISCNWTTVFLAFEQLYFLHLNKYIC